MSSPPSDAIEQAFAIADRVRNEGQELEAKLADRTAHHEKRLFHQLAIAWSTYEKHRQSALDKWKKEFPGKFSSHYPSYTFLLTPDTVSGTPPPDYMLKHVLGDPPQQGKVVKKRISHFRLSSDRKAHIVGFYFNRCHQTLTH